MGHSNITQAIKTAKLNKDEYFIFKKKQDPKFFKELAKLNLVSGNGVDRSPSMTLISESGLYKLVLTSNKDEALKFRDWVTGEVLPDLRKKAENYVKNVVDLKIQQHLNYDTQREQSIRVNGFNYRKGGVKEVMKYNVDSCLLVSGEKPSAVKKDGKKRGLPYYATTSAKQVFRYDGKIEGAQMSFMDNMRANGYDPDEVQRIGMTSALTLFNDIRSLGAIPKEMEMVVPKGMREKKKKKLNK